MRILTLFMQPIRSNNECYLVMVSCHWFQIKSFGTIISNVLALKAPADICEEHYTMFCLFVHYSCVPMHVHSLCQDETDCAMLHCTTLETFGELYLKEGVPI